MSAISALAVLSVPIVTVLPAAAQAEVDEASLDRLMQAMLFDDVVEILSDEGIDMVDDFVDAGYGVPRPAWREMLGRLYDRDVMAEAFYEEMAKALDDVDLAPMVAFYTSDLGGQIAQLELDTRKALADEAAQTAAGEAWAELDPETERARLIEDYVAVNDLVEMNVVGAMNSDIAYYQGLWSEGFEMGDALSDSDVLSQIWASEADVRADVSEWVYGFSTLAYAPLSDAELARYVAFSKSEAGKTLNIALFAAFDAVYADLSRGLGAGTAVLMQSYDGEEL